MKIYQQKFAVMLWLFSFITILSSSGWGTPIKSPVDALPAGGVLVDPTWTVADYDGTNGYNAVQVTGIYDFVDPPGADNASYGTANLLNSPYNATGRAAFFIGNNTDDNHPESLNIGQYGDGLLNGDDQFFALKDTDPQAYYQFDGLEFITQDDLQDVDKDGLADDPSWIFLGKQDGNVKDFEYGTIGGLGLEFNIADILDISFTYTLDKDGEISGAEWTLTPLDGILEKAGTIFGDNIFDHLAIVLKSADYFAVYDLDFNQIFDLADSDQLSFRPLKLMGTLNNDDLVLNGKPQAISHIDFWAHDPAEVTTVVPEPSTLILFGLGLLGLGVYGRRRKQ